MWEWGLVLQVNNQICSWERLKLIELLPPSFWMLGILCGLFLFYISIKHGFKFGFIDAKLKWLDNWRIVYVLILALAILIAGFYKVITNKYIQCFF